MGPQAGTIAFQSLTIGQILHAFSCRSENRSLFTSQKMPPNNYLNLAVFGSLGLQALAQLVPGLRSLLGIAQITALDAAVIGGAAVAPLLINELTKPSAPGEGDET
jgi:Ca2+-transporting ATPase